MTAEPASYWPSLFADEQERKDALTNDAIFAARYRGFDYWECQEDYAAVYGSEHKRIIIRGPPDHGKSWAITTFMLRLIANDPDVSICYVREQERYAMDVVRVMQTEIQEEVYKDELPHMRRGKHWGGKSFIIGGRKNKRLEVPTVLGIGFDQGVQGAHFDYIIFDDPFPKESAYSATYQKRAVDTFDNIWSFRTTPDTKIIILMNRLGSKDPGSILEERTYRKKGEDVKAWFVKDYKALEDAPDGTPWNLQRDWEHILCEERYGLDTLLELYDQAPISFRLKMQGEPIPPGGLRFDIKWFEEGGFIDDIPDFEHLEATAGGDWNFSEKDVSDNTAIPIMMRVTAEGRGKYSYAPEGTIIIVGLYYEHLSMYHAERAVEYINLMQDFFGMRIPLRSESLLGQDVIRQNIMRIDSKLDVIPITSHARPKVERISSLADGFASHRIKIWTGMMGNTVHASGLDNLMTEVLSFTGDKKTSGKVDALDAIEMGIRHWTRHRGSSKGQHRIGAPPKKHSRVGRGGRRHRA